MALSSLQVCMDSSDWLQGSINEENVMDSSSPSSGDILTCSRPLMERRLRPPHDQALKCPRCDSTHTKFCYYNNYSLSQPRYFCKTCRRYWTKGGTLRNIPVGGGCRKNKKISNSKKASDNNNTNPSIISHVISGPTSSTDLQISYLNGLLGRSHGNGTPTSFIDSKYNAFLGTNPNPRPIEFMENNKYENQAIIGHNFMGNGDDLGIMSNGMNDHFQTFQGNASTSTFIPTPYGMSLDGNSTSYNYGGAFMDTCQRLMLPNYEDNEGVGGVEVKPDTKLLALEWQQDQSSSCADQISAAKDNQHSFGYLNAGFGSWSAGLMNGYASSATNPLV